MDARELARRHLSPDTDAVARIEAFLDAHEWDSPVDIGQAIAERRRRAVREVEHFARQRYEPQASGLADGITPEWQQCPVIQRQR